MNSTVNRFVPQSNPLQYRILSAFPTVEPDSNSIFKLQWVFNSLRREPADHQFIATNFEVFGYAIHGLALDGITDLWASISFRISTIRNCNGISGVITSENGKYRVGKLVRIHSQLEVDKYFWSPLGNADSDYIRLSFDNKSYRFATATSSRDEDVGNRMETALSEMEADRSTPVPSW